MPFTLLPPLYFSSSLKQIVCIEKKGMGKNPNTRQPNPTPEGNHPTTSLQHHPKKETLPGCKKLQLCFKDHCPNSKAVIVDVDIVCAPPFLKHGLLAHVYVTHTHEALWWTTALCKSGAQSDTEMAWDWNSGTHCYCSFAHVPMCQTWIF